MRARRFHLGDLPVPGAKGYHLRIPGVYVRSVAQDRFGLTVTAVEGQTMAQGQTPKSVVPKHKSASWLSGLGGIAAGIAQFSGLVPDPYRKYVVGAGLIAGALAGMFGRNEGPGSSQRT